MAKKKSKKEIESETSMFNSENVGKSKPRKRKTKKVNAIIMEKGKVDLFSLI